TKLIEIIPFAGGNQDPVTWIEEFERMAVTNNFTDARRLQIISAYLKNEAAIWYTNAHQQQAFGYWDTQNQVDNQYAMRLYELYHRLETNANVYPEIEKVRKFTTDLRTELQIAVRPFGKNTWDGVVNRAKTCELTRYGAAMYITPNLNNNIVTPTLTSTNSVEIIMEALNKCMENLEKKIEKKLENNNQIQNIVVNDPQAENSKTPKAKKKRNPLQGPRFHKPMIGKDISKYSIVEDLQQIKANISIAQLATENPKYLRELRKTKEESSDESESEYESLSKSDESTEYESEQLEERIYTLNLWQEMEKENLKQIYSFDSPPKLNVGVLDEKQQEEFYDL
ncbi:19960_t:CDS:2, partial [Racocetra fulgida]